MTNAFDYAKIKKAEDMADSLGLLLSVSDDSMLFLLTPKNVDSCVGMVYDNFMLYVADNLEEILGFLNGWETHENYIETVVCDFDKILLNSEIEYSHRKLLERLSE